MLWVGLQYAIVACSGHNQLLFVNYWGFYVDIAVCRFLQMVHNNKHAIYIMIQILDLISINNQK